jgi:hypothetical protein
LLLYFSHSPFTTYFPAFFTSLFISLALFSFIVSPFDFFKFSFYPYLSLALTFL